ncbi:MAG: dipeptidase [Phycisphaerales bacterium]|nr:membrane dipeptidase [Planctomycetota bacterium]MCH8508612.1 dipeptidase [Phycisphaerales bacterium]
MSDPAADRWFDAHLDLAYLAETGRDLHAEPSDARGRHQPVAVTLPAMRAAGVGVCLGTIFTEPVDPDDPERETGPFAYADADPLGAWKAGMRQLKLYHAWRDAGLIQLMPARGNKPAPSDAPLRLGVLMEGADPIEHPEQLDEWADAGVIAIGLTWARRSRYAGGNATPMDDPAIGLSSLARELIPRIDSRGVVHDLSHLSQKATDELLAMTDAPVIASHSNARALMGGRDHPKTQRHLADETIRAIASRGGVIGVNLLSDFLHPDIKRGQRASIADVVRHADHIAEIAGSRRHVGLGSDADGGFGADRLPVGIDGLGDLDRVSEALRDAGWSDAEVTGFMHGNWMSFWGW